MEDNNVMGGVVVHCDHKFRHPYRPFPKQVKQLLMVRLNTRCYQSVVYTNNGTPLVSTELQPCSSLNIYTRSRNPRCRQCFSEIIHFLVQRHQYSFTDAVNEIYRLFDVVERKVQSMLLRHDELNENNNEHLSRTNFNEVFNYEVRIIINHGYRLCLEEEYRALVANGVAFERLVVTVIPANNTVRLLVIKGLEMVSNKTDFQEELLVKEEDNVCAICLDKLSIKVNKDEEREDDPTVQEKEVTTIKNDDNKTKNNKLIVKLPCKHVFHEGCIMKWIRRHHVCPFCRFQLPVILFDALLHCN